MKKFILIYTITILSAAVYAQDFDKNLASARSAYASGNLEDARFAMQQMLNDIDIIIGKEVMKLLPPKMDDMAANSKSDNVTANTGLAGVLIHRDYGVGEKTANVDIMSNSPLIASVNAILSIPFIGNSGDGTQKVVKVQGYKGVLQKSVDTETTKTNYTLQIPLNSSLLTLTVNDNSEENVLKMAGTIPLAQIVKMVH